MEAYIPAAYRTVTGATHPEVCPPAALVYALENAVAALDDVDALKKAYFYGRATDVVDDLMPDVLWNKADERASLDHIHTDVVHGIVGVLTEATELASLLVTAAYEGTPIDEKKLVDESGDALWYLALLFKKLGVSFGDVAAANIAKLSARYPTKFSLEAWEARDKTSESAAQEKALSH
jgi:phosphoribosyl-ATP pyrophosphohydrolase